MVAVGNRVLLRRVDHSLLSHVDLGFFVASALEPSMFIGSLEHRAHSDALLALCFLLDGVQENCFHPCWDCRVRIGNFSAKIVCPKGWKVALLWIFVIRPICRTNLTLQEDQLSGTEGSSMTECPCVAMLTAKRSRHGEAADGW